RRAASGPPIEWEGQRYRLDLAAAEMRRLRRIREKQGGASLDLAHGIGQVARAVAREKVDLRQTADTLKALSAELPPKTKPDPATAPPGVGTPRTARETIERAGRDLARSGTAADVSRRAPIGASLLELADRVAAEALSSLAYAIDIGVDDSAALLAGNVGLRHDFGFGVRDAAVRTRIAWGLPKPDVAPGTPWRLRGSLLGLDVGLSALSLRRINSDRIVGPPALTSNERDTFSM